MTRICVTSSGPTLESIVDPRFGRCAYFIFADPETHDFEAVSNEAAMVSGGAGVRAAQTVASKNVEAVLTGSVGPNAFPALQDAGIKILSGVSGTVKSAIESYNKDELQQLATPGPSNVGKGQGGPGRGLGMGYGYGMGMGRGMGRGGGGRGRRRGGRNR
ncbi:MAG: NifB/NifX family molybdenum-iron cluster-binding protein [Promethearchaeota archaeon]